MQQERAGVRFSIITVCLNEIAHIRDTLESALMQDYPDFEIIVKDGGSTDGTLDAVPQDDRIRIIEQPDTGIYQAMNQAVSAARGDYVFFLNSGDRFYDPTVLGRIEAELRARDDRPDILYGDIHAKGQVIPSRKRITKRYLYRGYLNHQTAFIRRTLFEELGIYREDLRICSDWVFFVDACARHKKYVHVPVTVAYYLGGGVSETEDGIQTCRLEKAAIRKTHYSGFERMCIALTETRLARSLLTCARAIRNGRKKGSDLSV